MDEAEARFELLKGEIEAVRSGIRSLDEVLVQVKSWCVTVTSAIAVAAVTVDVPAILWVGVGAAIVFWLVEAHFKSVQRTFIERDAKYALAVRQGPVLAALAEGALVKESLGDDFATPDDREGFWSELTFEAGLLWEEARKPLVFNIYALITLGLVIGFVVWTILAAGG